MWGQWALAVARVLWGLLVLWGPQATARGLWELT
jgi:hypothetical protein